MNFNVFDVFRAVTFSDGWPTGNQVAPGSSGGEARPGTSLLAPVAAGSARPSTVSGADAQSLSSSPTTLLCISNEDTCHWIRAQIIGMISSQVLR